MKRLNELSPGDGGRVRSAEGEMKKRLYDLGFTPGAFVQCALASPGRGMRAYAIRGTVIALRERDARQIMMEEKEHG